MKAPPTNCAGAPTCSASTSATAPRRAAPSSTVTGCATSMRTRPDPPSAHSLFLRRLPRDSPGADFMSDPRPANVLSTGTDYEALAQRFRPIFQRIAEGALEREQNRTLPREPMEWLKNAGFGAVRVPRESGGAGASLAQTFQLLIELAEADSNLPQALRGHFAFVEDRLNSPPSA